MLDGGGDEQLAGADLSEIAAQCHRLAAARLDIGDDGARPRLAAEIVNRDAGALRAEGARTAAPIRSRRR